MVEPNRGLLLIMSGKVEEDMLVSPMTFSKHSQQVVATRITRRDFSVIRSNMSYSTAAFFRASHFQYKYPGTPSRMIPIPTKASVGRVMIVFSVHAVPIRM